MGFKDSIVHGYNTQKASMAEDETEVNFATEADARQFFELHWAHGASNYGDIYGVVQCWTCNREWIFQGRKGAARNLRKFF